MSYLKRLYFLHHDISYPLHLLEKSDHYNSTYKCKHLLEQFSLSLQCEDALMFLF